MGRPVIDLTGQRYGIMTVMHRDLNARGGTRVSSKWVVSCGCGRTRSISSNVLRTLNQQSCGCLKGHNLSHPPKYGIPKLAFWRWANMMRRCYSPTSEKDKRNYMDRGIVVCPEWHDPRKYYVDMGDAPFDGATIDRVNNDGNYELKNCRWATYSEQNKNRRPSKRLKKGEYH